MKAVVALALVLASLLNRGGGDRGFNPAQMMRQVAIQRMSAMPSHMPIRPSGWVERRIEPEALRQVW